MNYLKKMCILRQIKQGFSGDGKALSGLVKVEQYGKNVAIEVSIINFAPLVSGEYYCLISDGKGQTETLPLRGKSLFNILSDIDISKGFCSVICYVKNEIVPIAYGINGDGQYDWKKILNATLPPAFSKNGEEKEQTAVSEDGVGSLSSVDDAPPIRTQEELKKQDYDDEFVAQENYYREEENEYGTVSKDCENVSIESAEKNKGEHERDNPPKDENAENLLHPFKTDSDGYYYAVKREIDELFSTYPRDDSLKEAFACSEWVRVKGEADSPQYLVGVVYDDGKAKYICYALATDDRNRPPEEIEHACTFVPASPFDENKGFFVIFQSAATGECIKPQRA